MLVLPRPPEPTEPAPHEILGKKLDDIISLLQAISNKLGLITEAEETNDTNATVEGTGTNEGTASSNATEAK